MSATLRWTWPIRVPGSIAAMVLRSSAWRSCSILTAPCRAQSYGDRPAVFTGRGLTRASLAPTNAGKPKRFKRLPFMADSGLAKTIEDAFEGRNDIGPSTRGPVRQAVEAALDLLD